VYQFWTYYTHYSCALNFLPSTKHCQQVLKNFQFLKLKNSSQMVLASIAICHLLRLLKLTALAFNGICAEGLKGRHGARWVVKGCHDQKINHALILCPPQSKDYAPLGENSLWSFRLRAPRNMCHVKLLLASRMCPTPIQCVLVVVVQNTGRNGGNRETPDHTYAMVFFAHSIMTSRSLFDFHSLLLISFYQ
jgi:hypothetical protein